MNRLAAALATVTLILWPAWGHPSPPLAPMFDEAAKAVDVPAGVTRAIAHVESGGSPWALNIEGRSYVFDSKEEALQTARAAADAGKSFDSGVMQVNSQWLRRYGIPLEAAIDPEANIYLGSWILKQEMQRLGRTWDAVAAYHSPDPARGRKYAELVKAALARGPVARANAFKKPTPSVAAPSTTASVVLTRTTSTLVVERRDGGQVAREEKKDSPFVQRLRKS
jgi:soluble lytic murein transglycosylase-like protein